jgi:hypothetical protein
MTYIVPMFWLMMDFWVVIDLMMDVFGVSRPVARWLAVLAVLIWPVAMVYEMMSDGGNE